jgi:hypothetical protein
MMYQYSDLDENKSVCQKKMEIKVLRLFVDTAVILSYSFQKKDFKLISGIGVSMSTIWMAWRYFH